MALSEGEESLALTEKGCSQCCLGLQQVNGSWDKSSIPITQFPAWNHRPGSPHPLQLMGVVGSTLSPLGAACSSSPPSSQHSMSQTTPTLHIPANISAGKRVQKPSPRWPSLSDESNRHQGWCSLCILPPSVLPH